MKRLFGENDGECYTGMATQIDSEIHHAVAPIIKRYVEEGYSMRELGCIAHGAVEELILETILCWRSDHAQASSPDHNPAPQV